MSPFALLLANCPASSAVSRLSERFGHAVVQDFKIKVAVQGRALEIVSRSKKGHAPNRSGANSFRKPRCPFLRVMALRPSENRVCTDYRLGRLACLPKSDGRP